jgi:hypothetical protein
MLMFFIQGLLCFYNKHPQLDPFFKKNYSWYTLKKKININGTIIDSNLYILFNCNDLVDLYI